MEASALRHAARRPVLAGLSPHLRLQSDERLVMLVRRGHDGAFEAIVRRYQARLLAFCRHMLGSYEDAEDALQEVLVSAYAAIRADERSIAVRPWLYRIARNRCLNRMRTTPVATAEELERADPGRSPAAADAAQDRAELRELVRDIRDLPEAQRAALLMKQVDALSYEQIATALDTSVAGVKSLLVRARVSLAEASEARRLTCAEVRLELGQAAEGIAKASKPARRHARDCARCRVFKRELRRTSGGLAALLPAGPLLSVQQLLAGKLGGGSATAGGSAAATGSGLGGGAALSTAGASVATKAAASLLAAGAVTVGAVEARDAVREPADGAQTAHVQPAPVGADREAGHRTGDGGEGERRAGGREGHGRSVRRDSGRAAGGGAHRRAAQSDGSAGAAAPAAAQPAQATDTPPGQAPGAAEPVPATPAPTEQPSPASTDPGPAPAPHGGSDEEDDGTHTPAGHDTPVDGEPHGTERAPPQSNAG